VAEGIRVVATDIDTGETGEVVIQPGSYVLTAAAPCRLASEQHYANGTVVLTLKGATPRYGSNVTIDHHEQDGDRG